MWLAERGQTVDDRGAGDRAELLDYPPPCENVCLRVVDKAAERGVVLDGSGLGETVACNKVRGIRAGLCHDVWSARISRGNNDSNVLVLAATVLAPEAAEEILSAWLDTPFNGGVHQRRLEQIAALEERQSRA